MRHLFLAVAAIALATPSLAEISTSVTAEDVPKPKQTELGLYVTARDAAAAVEADPSILFLDVRDPLEAMLLGLPESADAVIPVRLLTHEFDAERGRYRLEPNPDFLADVGKAAEAANAGKDDPVIVICQSGRRAAAAADALAEAGYSNVWAVVDGFSGDQDPETGERDVNGWKNANLPWTYDIGADRAWTP